MSDRRTAGVVGGRGSVAALSVLVGALGVGCDGSTAGGGDHARPGAEETGPNVVPESFAVPRDGVVARVGQLRPYEQADLCQGGLTCDRDALVLVLDPAATCDGWHLAISDHDPPRTRLVVVPAAFQAPGTYMVSEPWPIAARVESALLPSDASVSKLDILGMDASHVAVRTSGVTSIADGERTLLRCDTPASVHGYARPLVDAPGSLEVTMIGGGAASCSDPEAACEQGAEVLQVVLGPDQLAGGPLRVGDLWPKGCLPESSLDGAAVLEVTDVDGEELTLSLSTSASSPTVRELAIPICP